MVHLKERILLISAFKVANLHDFGIIYIYILKILTIKVGMKMKYLLLMAVIFCRTHAERQSVFERYPRKQYYDTKEMCKKVDLRAQIEYIKEKIRVQFGREFSQIERAEMISLIKQEIENREQFKARFNKLNMCNACQCMDWQIEDLIIELAYLLGVEEMKE